MKTCIVPPTAELLRSSELITMAGEHLLKGDRARAADALLAADQPRLLELFTWATSPRLRGDSPKATREALPREEQPPRIQPPIGELRTLHARDGYRCRYCSIRVIDRDVFKKLRQLVPEALRWGRANVDQHAAFLCLRASHDHVLPRAYGGENSLGNYVTACWICQFSHGDSLLADLGVENPFARPPVLDEWDGLRQILSLS